MFSFFVYNNFTAMVNVKMHLVLMNTKIVRECAPEAQFKHPRISM